MAISAAELQGTELSSFVELLTFDLTTGLNYDGTGNDDGSGSDTIQVTNEKASITFDGDVYTAEPIHYQPAAIEIDGSIPKPTLTISGTSTIFLAELNAYGSLHGVTFVRTKTMKKFLDGEPGADPSQKQDDIFFIDETISSNKANIKFALAIALGIERLFEPALPPITIRTFTV